MLTNELVTLLLVPEDLYLGGPDRGHLFYINLISGLLEVILLGHLSLCNLILIIILYYSVIVSSDDIITHF